MLIAALGVAVALPSGAAAQHRKHHARPHAHSAMWVRVRGPVAPSGPAATANRTLSVAATANVVASLGSSDPAVRFVREFQDQLEPERALVWIRACGEPLTDFDGAVCQHPQGGGTLSLVGSACAGPAPEIMCEVRGFGPHELEAAYEVGGQTFTAKREVPLVIGKVALYGELHPSVVEEVTKPAKPMGLPIITGTVTVTGEIRTGDGTLIEPGSLASYVFSMGDERHLSNTTGEVHIARNEAGEWTITSGAESFKATEQEIGAFGVQFVPTHEGYFVPPRVRISLLGG